MLRTLSIRDSKLWITIYCIVCCVLEVVAYAPGFMSPDSINQYEQALRSHYNDWHPPIFALLWHLLLKVNNSGLPVLVLQMLLLWSSVYILFSACKDKRWRVFILLFPWLPFVQNFSGYIIKDSHMALSLLAAVAFIFRGYVQERKLKLWELIVTLLLVVYAGIVRQNALPAVLPLFILIARLYSDKRLKVIVYSIVLVAITLLANKWQYMAAQPVTRMRPVIKLYMHDLTGIYAKTGDQHVFPEGLLEHSLFDTAYLRAHYTEATFDPIWWNHHHIYVVQGANDQQAEILHEYWKKAIGEYPGVYLSNHLKGFAYFLRIEKRTDEFRSLIANVHDNQYGLHHKRTFLCNLFLAPIEWQKSMPYMRPWFWLLVNLVLLLFIRKVWKPYRSVYVALLFSSLLYLLPSFFIYQTDTDFRYFYWNCIACSLAIIILVCYRRNGGVSVWRE